MKLYRVLYLLLSVLFIIWTVLTIWWFITDGGFQIGDFEPITGFWGYILGLLFSWIVFLIGTLEISVPAMLLHYKDKKKQTITEK